MFEAFFLVVLIVFIFLQNISSVIIPAISIMVSLVGTFIVMSLIGFSINLLIPLGMVPLSSFVKITKDYGPESVSRFNLYSSMGINGEAASGYSSGDAIRAVRETTEQVLPKGYSYEFSGISREESETSNNTVLIFVFCFVFVYPILCGLYESFLMPFFVLLSVSAVMFRT